MHNWPSQAWLAILRKQNWPGRHVPRMQLARPAAAISLADIVEAVEGPIALTACVEGTDCSVDHECRVRPHWPLVNETLRRALADISLVQLAQEKELA